MIPVGGIKGLTYSSTVMHYPDYTHENLVLSITDKINRITCYISGMAAVVVANELKQERSLF